MGALDCSHIVNVQGDEILVLPSDLSLLVQAIMARPDQWAWNAIARIENSEELADPSVVKCVVSKSNRILFCSRDFRFLPLKLGHFDPVRKILGILAYQSPFLESYLQMHRTPLELIEGIDQSRVIENDVTLNGIEFSHGYPGINEPREVALVESYLSKDIQQQWILEKIRV